MAKNKAESPKMGDLIKQLPTVVTPVQEVRPVETKPAAEELVKINGFFAPKALAQRMKIHGVTADMSQREILIAALEAYLPKEVIT